MRNERKLLRAMYISLLVVGVVIIITEFFNPQKSLKKKSEKIGEKIDSNNKDALVKVGEISLKNEKEDLKLLARSKEFSINTKIYQGIFSTYRANLISLKLKKHLNLAKKPTELLDIKDQQFLDFNFDSMLNTTFEYNKVNDLVHEFKSNLEYQNSKYEYIKRYTFSEEEYLIKLDLILNSIEDDINQFNEYTLSLNGEVEKLSKKGELEYSNYTRQIIYYDNKLRTAKSSTEIENPLWVGFTTKYFEILLSKPNVFVKFKQNKKILKPIFQNKIGNNKNIHDVYNIYAGPKDSKYLGIFDKKENNSFELESMNFEKSISKGVWYWVQIPMRLVMQIFYDVIPNWGISIILLTIFVRILIFPLTYKSLRSTSELSKLQPKIKELQLKYKDNVAKLNESMGRLYKEEGVNPLGVFLPILLQMPIFFGLYGLVNNFFALKGAIFVPNWIDDLSIGDSIYYFGYRVPFIGWTSIRLLPFMMMITQLLSTIFSSNLDLTTIGRQQKFLYFGMPVMFFFLLYNMPSGLLLYWITTNIFTILQQYYIRKYFI